MKRRENQNVVLTQTQPRLDIYRSSSPRETYSSTSPISLCTRNSINHSLENRLKKLAMAPAHERSPDCKLSKRTISITSAGESGMCPQIIEEDKFHLGCIFSVPSFGGHIQSSYSLTWTEN